MSVPATQMNSTQTLTDLLRGFADAPAIEISGVTSDSRDVAAGDLFIACQGINSHGLDFLPQVLAAGVAAVVWESHPVNAPDAIGVPLIEVPNLSEHVGEIASRFYQNPSSQLSVVGVTGTNGKTTVAWLLAQCLQHLDKDCGYIGTLGAGVKTLSDDVGMTTPAAVQVQAHLAEFVEQGATHAALEVSSHALSQGRVGGVYFDAVMFNNLTRDHLDYHGDMAAYFEAKASLFSDYPSNYKIVNVDTEFGAQLASRCGNDVIRVSIDSDRKAAGGAYLFVRTIVAEEQGTEISFDSSWGIGELTLPLVGDFNVSNAASVLAYLLASGVSLEQSCDVLQLVSAPPGRMQQVASSRVAIFVDFAHTPDAIDVALRTLRSHCSANLWCVFGCGGDRDRGKRSHMGRVAEQLADKLVITSDNPRNESTTAIIDDILAGIHDKDAATVIEDRAAAIAWAVKHAAPGDLVLIAGKGHENYQEIGGERRPFSDVAVASAAAGEQS